MTSSRAKTAERKIGLSRRRKPRPLKQLGSQNSGDSPKAETAAKQAKKSGKKKSKKKNK